MNFPIIFYILGWVLNVEAALMLLPVLTGILYGESSVISFLITIALCLAIGIPLVILKPKDRVFYVREGFVTVALCWIVMSIMGALPFLFSGSITHPVDVFFETVSGFTARPRRQHSLRCGISPQMYSVSGEVLPTGSEEWEFLSFFFPSFPWPAALT